MASASLSTPNLRRSGRGARGRFDRGTVDYGVAFGVIERSSPAAALPDRGAGARSRQGARKRYPQINRAEITVRKPNAPVAGVLDHVEVTVAWPDRSDDRVSGASAAISATRPRRWPPRCACSTMTPIRASCRLLALPHAALGQDRPARFPQCRGRDRHQSSARALLDLCLDIERALKRERRERWGPRTSTSTSSSSATLPFTSQVSTSRIPACCTRLRAGAACRNRARPGDRWARRSRCGLLRSTAPASSSYRAARSGGKPDPLPGMSLCPDGASGTDAVRAGEQSWYL